MKERIRLCRDPVVDQEAVDLEAAHAEEALAEAAALAAARAEAALAALARVDLAREARGDPDALILAAVGAGGIIIAPIITVEVAALAA